MKHYPVMLPEVLSALAIQANETCVDGTFGNGGYSEAILNSAECSVVGLDRDPNVMPRASELAAKWGDQFRLCLLYTSPSPRDQRGSRMPSSA